QTLRAGVLVTLVAEHAVVNLTEDFARLHARIGQRKTVAAAESPIRSDQRFGQLRGGMLHRNQIKGLDVFGKTEDDPVAVRAIVYTCGTPALQGFNLGTGDLGTGDWGLGDWGLGDWGLGDWGLPSLLQIHERAACARNSELAVTGGGAGHETSDGRAVP